MFATVELHSGNVQRAIVAPASAIVATGSRRTAFVEQGPGIFQERPVDIGDEIDGSVVVRSGLREGDRVVVRGGLLLSQQLAEARSSR